MPVDQTSLDRIRNATFPSARRGYDKQEVEKFLGRLADWLETGGGEESRSDAVKKELEKVGERTGAILAQAEESAQGIRAEAEEEARGTINAANTQAAETRAEADSHASEARTAADRQARDAIAEAEAQARRIVEDAERRREDIEALVGDLTRRREDVIADAEELARKLKEAADQHRSGELERQLGSEQAEEEPEVEGEETEATHVMDREGAEQPAASEAAPPPTPTEQHAVAPEPDETPTDIPAEPRSGDEADLRR